MEEESWESAQFCWHITKLISGAIRSEIWQTLTHTVFKTGEEFEILVIDTAEPLDNTKGVCEEFGARYINQEEPAFAGAFKTGIKYAEKDKFLILDSDGSHNPKYIPDLYKKFVDDKCDVVIGSRYVEGGKTNDAKSSIVLSHTYDSRQKCLLP